MLAVTGFTPLLVNLESMASKPHAGGGSKKMCPEGRALVCTCRQGHHGFFYGLGERVAAAGLLSHTGRCANVNFNLIVACRQQALQGYTVSLGTHVLHSIFKQIL